MLEDNMPPTEEQQIVSLTQIVLFDTEIDKIKE